MYYIISVTHTREQEDSFTLWRPKNQGYCTTKKLAGIYEEVREGYHNSDGNIPVEVEVLDKLFVIKHNGDEILPNNHEVRRALGIKYTRNGFTIKRKTT